MKKPQSHVVTLEKIVGGGQSLGTLDDGRKLFAWGGLPGERVTVQTTKKKSRYIEGVVTHVEQASPHRVEPRDPDSYLSTSPWQIMNFDAEQHYKAALIEEAFELHNIVLPEPISVYTDGVQFEYRNKIEYSFWYDTNINRLQLAFYRRGTHGKIPVEKTSLAKPAITACSQEILNALNALHVEGRALKTLLIRANQSGEVAWQLYVKDPTFPADTLLEALPQSHLSRGEVIYSDSRSPASVITKRLTLKPHQQLSDSILGIPFRYATEGFFQINLPVYEQALRDMQQWISPHKPVLDLYSGVGSIGLTIGGHDVTLVETNEHAVREMKENITALGLAKQARAVLAASEHALEYITKEVTVIIDPPRAGLHDAIVERLLQEQPARIIYLSCNPVTQARDISHLSLCYGIRIHNGYNFFPRTPHIEHLVILDLKNSLSSS